MGDWASLFFYIVFVFVFAFFFFFFFVSLAAYIGRYEYMRQVPDFLIGLRNKTARKKSQQ
jgi:pilus assembly protein TadC